MDFGWFGDLDAAAAVSFLQDQPDVDDTRIAAVGMSMGGEEALGAAASDDRIRAVVAEGATNRMSADRAWLSDEYGWRGVIQEGVEWLLYRTADVLTSAEPPLSLRDAVSAIAPRPVLLIAAGNVAEEGHASEYIQGAAPKHRRPLGRTRYGAHRGARHSSRRVGGPCHNISRRTRSPSNEDFRH